MPRASGEMIMSPRPSDNDQYEYILEDPQPNFAQKISKSVFFKTESGTVMTTCVSLMLLGLLFGLTVPPNDELSKPYRYISNIVGYIYFWAWSLSFYPQIFLNWQRRSTIGLSTDYQLYNILGHSYYAIFNVCFYLDPTIQTEYKDRNNGNSNKVQIQDVMFSLHAVFATAVTLAQSAYYDGKKQTPSLMCRCLVALGLLLGFVYAMLVLGRVNGYRQPFQWLDFVLFLSYIKLAITLLKYTPQAMLNYRRKSTVGWNIWNVLLDLVGGSLSLLQLLLDCWDTHDWGGIAGDPVKFGLGFVSIVFDIIFIIQHYVLYPEANDYKTVEEVIVQ